MEENYAWNDDVSFRLACCDSDRLCWMRPLALDSSVHKADERRREGCVKTWDSTVVNEETPENG